MGAFLYGFLRIMRPIDDAIAHYDRVLHKMREDDEAAGRAQSAGIVTDPNEQRRSRGGTEC